MKLEFIDDAFDGKGLLLLHSGSASDVKRLRTHARELAVTGSPVRVHTLEFIDVVDSCELTLATGRSSRGVQRARDGPRFELHLSPSDWSLVADLLGPFCAPEAEADDGARFQRLHRLGGMQVIYSTARQW